MAEAFIVDAVRTPIGRFRGALKSVRPDDLAAQVLRAVLQRNNVEGALVDEVFLGCANQAGEDNRNVARMALLLGGLPPTVPGVTVNRLCASGLEAVIQGCRMIQLGDADIVLAGGVESMTRAPWSMPKPEEGFPSGKCEAWDTALGWRYPNPRLAQLFPLEQMGETAENVARKWGIPREAQDGFALASHRKAVAAQATGAFLDELVAVEVTPPKGALVRVEVDEGPRADTSLEKLSALKPAFQSGGSVTAGNSSTLNDGASAVLLMSEKALRDTGARALARYVSSASVGVDPRYMGVGPVPATRKALARAGWSLDSVDLVELNEAFAAQALACLRDLELPPERVNVNGGGIALGHPLGSSGARILTTLVHALKRQGARRGLATLCVGVGQGLAMTVERDS
ncbi:acetyl-CoA acetyltransferase [Myxococcus stipitatus DSM 14675]|uniref:Acetyl-CoA acetyltransferase n=1 Tax=Myxococcus stipitatus (strain DSM 14675 / JCM 12634 / Mx s8) TaxID=1278073 RepID=L7U636_MYXSD|nr:thiolase family protein [Myxococcus stipitatus]AGC43320.1 acetyl-CoA acetyltransferase [Myxococcus stipitatus DSM 14675]